MDHLRHRVSETPSSFFQAVFHIPPTAFSRSGLSSPMETRLIATLTRLLGAMQASNQKSRKKPSVQDLFAIRQALLDCLADCDSATAQRLRHKINQAQTPQDLWLLRNDAYQIISQRHNQTVAAERINALIARFQGWIDAKQLVRIK